MGADVARPAKIGDYVPRGGRCSLPQRCRKLGDVAATVLSNGRSWIMTPTPFNWRAHAGAIAQIQRQWAFARGSQRAGLGRRRGRSFCGVNFL